MREDPMLERLLSQHRAAVNAGAGPSADHPDVDTLARHASGQLGGDRARDVASHLLACDDGRCIAFLRSQAEDAHATHDMLYPADPDTPSRTRTFQCKAGLWDTFAQVAQQVGVSLDELIEEAMTEYARARGHIDAPTDPRRQPARLDETMDAASASASQRAARRKPDPTELDDSDSMPAASGRAGAGVGARRGSLMQPTPPPGTIRMPGRPGRPPQPVSAARAASMPPLPPPGGPMPPPPPARPRITSSSTQGRVPGAPPSARSLPPALPAQPAPSAQPLPMSTMKSARTAAAPTLTLTYQGRPYVVDKDRFMLGRSKTAADLRLDDANVSRQHAMIEHVGGTYYIVDLGSTNGIFVSGERVARRALRDGDLIEITTHHIRVTLV
jgi:hypothetical protein